MKQSLFTLEHTRQLTDDTYELVLCPAASSAAPFPSATGPIRH